MKSPLQNLCSDSLKSQLLKGAGGSAVLKLINIPLMLGTGVLLARSLGPENYGLYSFVLAIVTMLALPTKAGIPTLLVKEVAKKNLNNEWGLIRGILKLSNSVVFGYSVIVILSASIFVYTYYGPEESFRAKVFFWSLPMIPLIAFEGLRTGALRGLSRVIFSQIPEAIVRPVLMLTFLSIFIFLGKEITSIDAMRFQVIAAVSAFLIGSAFLLYALPHQVRNIQPEYAIKPWAKSLIPLSIFAGVQLLDAQISIILLGFLGNNDEQVALLRVASTGAGLVVFSLTAVNMTLGPHVARLYAAGEIQKLQQILSVSVRGAMFFAVPIALIFIFWGDAILLVVFGIEYAGAAPLLVILSVAQLINCAAGSVATILHMTGNENSTVFGSVIGLLANVFFGVILIPLYGAMGAAYSFAASIIIWNVILMVMVKRRLGLKSYFFVSVSLKKISGPKHD